MLCSLVTEPELVSDIIPRVLGDILDLAAFYEGVDLGREADGLEMSVQDSVQVAAVDSFLLGPVGLSHPLENESGHESGLSRRHQFQHTSPRVQGYSNFLLTKYSAATHCQGEICNGFSDGGVLAGGEFGAVIAQLRREKACRERKDIWPANIASHMGITRSAYSQWESGKTRPRDVGVYRKLAAYLNVKLSDLGVNVDEMLAEPPKRATKAHEVPAPDTRTHAKKKRQGGS